MGMYTLEVSKEEDEDVHPWAMGGNNHPSKRFSCMELS